jgi:hypothetical protein
VLKISGKFESDPMSFLNKETPKPTTRRRKWKIHY